MASNISRHTLVLAAAGSTSLAAADSSVAGGSFAGQFKLGLNAGVRLKQNE